MKLSIVATLYRSSPHVDEFYDRATRTARDLVGSDYEIILVVDGSPDNSLAQAVQIADQDEHVVVVDLSRNFGHHKAMMTGLAEAQGEKVFLIDSDLEEQPEWLNRFSAEMGAHDCDVVYGVQQQRKGHRFERWSGRIFYPLFRALTGIDLPENLVTARLMTRRYVQALLRFDESEVFIPGLWHITGFDQRALVVEKLSSDQSTYSLGAKLALFVNSVTSFSNAPLVGIFYIGVGISVAACAYTGYLIVHWTLGTPPSGWTSVMASIWLIGGLIISFIGIVGIYLSKVFSETKRRPYTIIRQVYGRRSA